MSAISFFKTTDSSPGIEGNERGVEVNTLNQADFAQPSQEGGQRRYRNRGAAARTKLNPLHIPSNSSMVAPHLSNTGRRFYTTTTTLEQVKRTTILIRYHTHTLTHTL